MFEKLYLHCDPLFQICNCNDASMMGILETEEPNSNLPYCLQFNPDLNITYKNDECSRKQRLLMYQSCSLECAAPCKEYDYTTDYSQSYWPVDASSRRFYNEYILGKPYEYR